MRSIIFLPIIRQGFLVYTLGCRAHINQPRNLPTDDWWCGNDGSSWPWPASMHGQPVRVSPTALFAVLSGNAPLK
jgi:hypothetical protein